MRGVRVSGARVRSCRMPVLGRCDVANAPRASLLAAYGAERVRLLFLTARPLGGPFAFCGARRRI
ncbi:hypothetical protein BRN03_13235 [Xanthomonas oryzae pv. oryzae]|nr:hypothetical protein BRN29_22045 [Xanthomonas oryzae pv. oryzae]RBD16249.1 hypothetical protein BRM56_18745 [Xanthomonas oryzae pv. oryzae]RBE56642.1 hypothetical protein BRN03_13235 [Xanthomonas oryzae pv. oryzae]RBG18420.1 hypothetical protein BRM59_15600 [Xanthomonas oryzae pv. oryzae]RBG26120.1 hypothetical protein BRM58_06890 [Xanthomonas oryzae pv. oryzae]